ncbi:MAG: helix-turn-helix domain-containing protein [Alphaproteobacteria bacterium]|nr:helix-turn-helix domain-containing protein [Alphaproteobacteria bacterium]
MNSNTPTLVSISDACERLSVCRATIYRLIKSGQLDTVSIGASRRIRSESLEQLIANGAEKTAA